ncbi:MULTISPECIES: c-type cytochrome [unclassified Paraburkholderia]|uniref:c-type cytochrome n=1 Tax=unclassified Paraburkholderia TaxID=2615204 RepID=UPI00162277DA|nr:MULTISPECIES: c-type cytochrome [unclassified Paraburkholderia]MBB5441809.1 cytochrome c [Paraburkholderia sp. WSM4177]MBB5482205.1 cytochrome c [Paraburkholderia sp. WSM4180]
MRGMTRAGVVFALVVGALAGTMTWGARAAEAPRGQQVAAANACMGCHAVDRKLVGPSFQQIAAKYKGDAQAPTKLARKVKDGGSGVWGMIPMPAHQSMSDADIRAVVDWVLAGAPSR